VQIPLASVAERRFWPEFTLLVAGSTSGEDSYGTVTEEGLGGYWELPSGGGAIGDQVTHGLGVGVCHVNAQLATSPSDPEIEADRMGAYVYYMIRFVGESSGGGVYLQGLQIRFTHAFGGGLPGIPESSPGGVQVLWNGISW
jgi:hypothetical protein